MNLKKPDEKILVVARSQLFDKTTPQGLIVTNLDAYQKSIQESKEFLWRSEMEINPDFKQIIPYLIFNFEDKYFLMKRKSNPGDLRLSNNYSLGIGGHIRQEDLQSSKINGIEQWAEREFIEEVNYKGDLTIEPIGILNDESNEVGRVHTGFVFLLKGTNDQISIKDEHKWGGLVTLKECSNYYHQMESWSQMVFDYLVKKA